MAENPLLPDAELRRLYTLLKATQRTEAAAARRLARSSASSRLGRRTAPIRHREALLAASLMQLAPGDLCLVASSETATLSHLLAPAPDTSAPQVALVAVPSSGSLLWSAATAAASLKALGQGGLVLALTRAGAADHAWADALAWAQGEQLPLVVACADPSGADAFSGKARSLNPALNWTSAGVVTRRLQLPVLSVDGADSVAVYRVMQESALRARAGGGPAMLWAVFPELTNRSAQAAAGTPAPLVRLGKFLRTRGIRP